MVKRVLRDLELAGVINDDHYGGYLTSDLAVSVQATVKQLFTAIRSVSHKQSRIYSSNFGSGLITVCSKPMT